MRQRKETWILTFAGTTQAMQMEQYARAHGLPGRMIPVPREITAGCGCLLYTSDAADECVNV